MNTAQSNVELFKTANKTASFIVEAMLDFKAADGKTYNKIVVVIVKRDQSNKALATVRYFLDIAPTKVICHDLWTDGLCDEHSEYKALHGTERALKITPLESGGDRFSVMNKSDGGSESLYFDLSRFQCRCLSRTVIDYLHCYELADMIAEKLHKGDYHDARTI